MMVAGLLLAALLLASGPRGDAFADAVAALQAGRFEQAAAHLERMPTGPRRQEGWTRLYLAAGDPVAGLAAARAGLASDPEDLDLLYQAAKAALWVAAGEAAVGFAGRLEEAIAATPGLSAEQRAQWLAAAGDLRAQGEGIVDQGRACARASSRARTASLGLLAAAVAALVLLARRG